MGGAKNNFMITILVPVNFSLSIQTENLTGTQGKFEGRSLLYVNSAKGNVK